MMAEANAATADLRVCAVCLDDMTSRNPRALSCLHTFCETCLDKLAAGKDNITCPSCRKVTVVPDGRVAELPVNFMFKAITCNIPNNRICHLCEGDTKRESSYTCSDCSVDMCSTCMKEHLRNKRCSDHQIDIICKEPTKNVCKVHRLPTKFLCSCEEKLCAKCLSASKHASHELNRLDDMSSPEKLENARLLILELANTKLSIAQASKLQIPDVKQQILMHSDMLRQKIAKSEEKLLTRLAGISQLVSLSENTCLTVCEQLQDPNLQRNLNTSRKRMLKLKDDISKSAVPIFPEFRATDVDVEIGQLTGGLENLTDENLKLNEEDTRYEANEEEKPDTANGWKVEKGEAFHLVRLENLFPFPPDKDCPTKQTKCERIEAELELEVTSSVGFIKAGPFEAINGGGAVITDATRPRIIVINRRGRVCLMIPRNVPSPGAKALAVYRDVIFVVLEKELHRLQLQLIGENVYVTCQVTSVNQAVGGKAALDGNRVILLLSGKLSRIDFGVHIAATTLTEKKEGDTDLKGITVSKYFGDLVICVLVTCKGWHSRYENKYARFYDCTGRFLQNVSVGMAYENTVITPFGTLLCGCSYDCVTEYDTGGTTLRHLKDIKASSVSFDFPSLWVLCNNGSVLRKYKIYHPEVAT